MIYGTVSLLGDSILFGARSRIGGPAELLAPLLNKHPNRSPSDKTQWACLNRSVSGETTLQILRRAPAVVRELAAMPGAKRLVVMAGTNDSKPPGLQGADYTAQLRQLLHWAERFGIEATLCLLPPVDPEAMPAYDRRSNEIIRDYNARLLGVAAEFYGRLPLRVCDLSILTRGDFCDGVHLSEDGCRKVAGMLADTMMGAPDV